MQALPETEDPFSVVHRFYVSCFLPLKKCLHSRRKMAKKQIPRYKNAFLPLRCVKIHSVSNGLASFLHYQRTPPARRIRSQRGPGIFLGTTFHRALIPHDTPITEKRYAARPGEKSCAFINKRSSAWGPQNGGRKRFWKDIKQGLKIYTASYPRSLESSSGFHCMNTNILNFLQCIPLFYFTLWLLYVPPGLTFTNSTFCPHSVFVCFVWISEQTAIISPYSINWLVFITETECVYCAVWAECWTLSG
jgi:hypothetical protein